MEPGAGIAVSPPDAPTRPGSAKYASTAAAGFVSVPVITFVVPQHGAVHKHPGRSTAFSASYDLRTGPIRCVRHAVVGNSGYAESARCFVDTSIQRCEGQAAADGDFQIGRILNGQNVPAGEIEQQRPVVLVVDDDAQR